LCAAGDAEAGANTAAAPGKAAHTGKSGWAWGRCAIAVSQAAMACNVTRRWATRACPRRPWGGDDAVLGGARHGPLDGLEAGIDDVNRAHVGSPDEPFQGGAARQWRRFERGPAAADVTKERRIFVGKPLQDLRQGVFAGPGHALGPTALVTAQTTAGCDEWGEGPHGGALGL